MTEEQSPVVVEFESAQYVIAMIEAPPFGVIFEIVLKVVVSLFLISLVFGALYFAIIVALLNR